MNDPVARLREYIADSGFTHGGRLPPERHLTGELGMSRSTLRRALDALERDGVIWRHVGKGTFNAHPEDGAGGTEAHTGAQRIAETPHQLGRQLTPSG